MVAPARRIAIAGVLLASLLSVWSVFAPAMLSEDLPSKLSDEVFWRIITEFSEPGGFFRSDNFVSNEMTFQYVIPALIQSTKQGGAYLGVGPDQNFSYLVALRPKIAFIVDIRRQNMLQHLMYKALIELSSDRADFLSLLFSRKRPPGLGANSTAEGLFRAYEEVPPTAELFDANLRALMDHLTRHHGFKLDADDEQSIEYVYDAFYKGGPNLKYSASDTDFSSVLMPRYSELMTQNDGQNQNRSYLAREENFSILKELQENNLVIPLVGDFGGPTTLRSVAQYLKDHGMILTTFYTSNVEQYLFDGDAWKKFYSGVKTFPVDSSSTFIRAYFNPQAYGGPALGFRSVMLLSPIDSQIKAFDEGRIASYSDVIRLSNQP
jgi:hypothetical protein